MSRPVVGMSVWGPSTSLMVADWDSTALPPVRDPSVDRIMASLCVERLPRYLPPYLESSL